MKPTDTVSTVGTTSPATALAAQAGSTGTASAARMHAPRAGTAKLTTLSERGTADSRKLAAVILEVLAGARTPTDAATATGVSLPRYYALEARALAGLVEACEPQPRGKRRSAESECAGLRRELDRARKESARFQALVRVAQRTIGLPAAPQKTTAAGRRRRKPTVRALKAASVLQSAPVAPAPVEGPHPQG